MKLSRELPLNQHGWTVGNQLDAIADGLLYAAEALANGDETQATLHLLGVAVLESELSELFPN